MNEGYIKVLETQISELRRQLAELKAYVNNHEKRIKDIEDGEIGTGVYLDGVPEYAVEYIKGQKKEGE